MNKRISLLRKAPRMILVAFAAFTFGSCTDEISTEARYTFTGNTVASYLEENEEYFSSFIEILKRGERFSLMKAYGTYTCFAPTNEAVAQYLYEQDSIYWATKDTDKPIDNGIHSPELSELSDSMCKVISQTHLIDRIYLTTDMTNDIIPRMNLNDRYLSSKYDIDTVTGRPALIINNTAKVIERDVEVVNGVVHAISSVLAPSTNTVPTQLGQYEFFSIFTKALEETGLADSLQLYKDWKGNDRESEYEWDGELVEHFDENVLTGRPLARYYGYSVFVETDSTFAEYGINSYEDLINECKKWYPEATDEDITSPNNALHRFVSYHIVPRKVTYENLTFTNKNLNWNFEDHWVPFTDRNEYYETQDNRLIKVTTPRSVNNNDNRRVINFSRKGASMPNMEKHVNILVCDPNDVKATYPKFDQVALNGIIHVIDKVLIYDEEEMRSNIMNCIMRFDIAALVPELVTNDIRWTKEGDAGAPGQSGNINTYCICNETDNYLEHSRHFKQNSKESRLFYLCPHADWINYQGDEFIATGKFDIAYKLPPVPEGTYEIRIGYSQSGLRGIVQFYVDDIITGIPIDLIKTGADPIVGWKPDTESKNEGDVETVNGTEYAGIINDKEMKNRGYLKGPSSYKWGSTTAREDVTSLRKVLVTKYLTSDVDHWLRLKNVTPQDNGFRQIMHDYIEIVPIGYVRNEEISFVEKRK